MNGIKKGPKVVPTTERLVRVATWSQQVMDRN